MLQKLIFAALLSVAIATPRELPVGKSVALALQNASVVFDSLSGEERLASVQDIVDIFMTEVRKLMADLGFDPMKMPDVHRNFSFKPIIITYHGELDLDKGWAQDVSEFYRNGDASLDYSNRQLRIEVPFKFNKILFNYDYNMKLMNIGPDGGVEGYAKDVQVFFSLLIDFENMHVTLEKFDIVKIGKITCKFTDNGIIDWIVNLLSWLCTSIFKGLITWIVEVVARSILNDIVDVVNNLLEPLKPDYYLPYVGPGKI